MSFPDKTEAVGGRGAGGAAEHGRGLASASRVGATVTTVPGDRPTWPARDPSP